MLRRAASRAATSPTASRSGGDRRFDQNEAGRCKGDCPRKISRVCRRSPAPKRRISGERGMSSQSASKVRPNSLCLRRHEQSLLPVLDAGEEAGTASGCRAPPQQPPPRCRRSRPGRYARGQPGLDALQGKAEACGDERSQYRSRPAARQSDQGEGTQKSQGDVDGDIGRKVESCPVAGPARLKEGKGRSPRIAPAGKGVEAGVNEQSAPRQGEVAGKDIRAAKTHVPG